LQKYYRNLEKNSRKKEKCQDSLKPYPNERKQDLEGTVYTYIPDARIQFCKWNENIVDLYEIFQNQESLR
jgi:hypothetical protein